jgi:hypothetical protein
MYSAAGGLECQLSDVSCARGMALERRLTRATVHVAFRLARRAQGAANVS